MDNTIHVMIRERIATADRAALYVCGNSDYSVLFDFDDEWAKWETKTARFNYAGQRADIVFTGDRCPVPVIANATHFYVGVYAGDLHTSTPAYVSARKSILCGGTLPPAPAPDVYMQIMELLNNALRDMAGKVDIRQGEEHAGCLLYVDGAGNVAPLALGDGLEIADGVLRVTGTGAVIAS